ncbi:MAG: (NiFe) hydrogenase maturation protein HypF [Candidatus Sulfotelmatobacter sp.]|nr:(NiFe) hydrogenase maturation protein HypF [Candidatus Sulfotelmatobacter sp.]
MASACSIRVRGVVQGVGFRPFVYRLACANTLSGWVLNAEEGIEIHLEGAETGLEAFVRDLRAQPPPAASIAEIDVRRTEPVGVHEFTIRSSQQGERPTVRISPDLPVCNDCLRELFDPSNRRYLYPYINCTNCGPRYSVVLGLPYDRPKTTMKDWPLDEHCTAEYTNPGDRRFHAQPVACSACGPNYYLHPHLHSNDGGSGGSIRRAAEVLRAGGILAVKGLGGYHLACDARNPAAVAALRDRKYRKEKPFALMAKDIAVARTLVELSADSQLLLTSAARPIVLAPARIGLPEVAPGNNELGVMLPYTPLHHLLFAAGAPEILVMTSANRSSEPIAYEDDDALQRLAGIADSFLIGQRPIARRVDDSVARVGACGPVILRRARGYAPGAVASLPTVRPILALGADLKNSITLAVDGQAFVSQHIGDLDHYQSFRAFQETIEDLVSMYEVRWDELLLVCDLHPQYLSTCHAATLGVPESHAVQHHRAHVASVLAERGEWTKRVIGVSFDGTGYGDDGSIWGGEIFVGSVQDGFERVAHLRRAVLAGGDAAAKNPVQAAAGFLAQVDGIPDVLSSPFDFPERYCHALELVPKDVRTFGTTSVGRLFDTAAALVGFTREITFEGQAAIWLEQLARGAPLTEPYPFSFVDDELDFRPLLLAVAQDRVRGRNVREIARAFHRGIAQGLCDALHVIAGSYALDTVVLSGGVFQNELLLEDLKSHLAQESLQAWTNHAVPPNDGGISLGQAALAAFGRFDVPAGMNHDQKK